MNNVKNVPHMNMNQKKWENLAIFAIIIFYVFQIIFLPIKGSICREYGFDYCAFWSAGKLAREHNLENIYDLELLKQIQKEIYPYDPRPSTIFTGAPVAYLPVFVLPFTILSTFDLPLSFLFWTILNLIVYILYLKFFTRDIFGYSLSNKLLLLFMLPLPVFVNFQEGQVNIWLLICAGEFIRAILHKEPFKAGICLSGWLLKPQLLILIVPIILLQKKKKILTGLLISASSIFLISFLLVGMEGIFALKNLILGFSSGLPSNNIGVMANWRMVGWHITPLTSSTTAWPIIILGTLFTLITPLIYFNWKQISDSDHIVITILGIFAATLAATWHVHIHMAIILIPPILYLMLKDRFNHKLFSAWVFIPVLLRFISYIILILVEVGNASINPAGVVKFFTGFPSFVLNLIILGWAIHQFNANKLEVQERVIG